MFAKKFFQLFIVAAILVTSLGLVPHALANAACGNTFTVLRGDTLRKIASRCSTSVDALTRANPQIKNANLIYVGQVLMLPGALIAGTGSYDIYIVDRGDTLNKLAARFGTTVKKLMDLNSDITNASVIYEGQRLLVPSVSLPNTGGQIYTVQPGDTLNKIAARYHTTVDAIMKVNSQIKNASLIYVGQRIVIPQNEATYYTVQRGDTLRSIAVKFNTSVADLLVLNPNIINPNLIFVAQVIRVS